MVNVLRLAVLIIGLLATGACTSNPNFRQASPEEIMAGADIFRAQQQSLTAIVCPSNTRRREWVEAETRVRSGRGGQPTANVRVQCIPNDARPGEIPPLAQPATPLPLSAPQQRQVAPWGRQIPYQRNFDPGYRPPGHYFGGWHTPPGTVYRGPHQRSQCWTGTELLNGPCLFIR